MVFESIKSQVFKLFHLIFLKNGMNSVQKNVERQLIELFAEAKVVSK